MSRPAGIRPLGSAPVCASDPDTWMLGDDTTPERIREAAAGCGTCWMRERCLATPTEYLPRGTVLGGMVVTIRDGQLRAVEDYLVSAFGRDEPEPEALQTYAGIDVSDVDVDLLRRVMAEQEKPWQMNRKTRQVAIAVGVIELGLSDAQIARRLPTSTGKAHTEGIQRTRKHVLKLPPGGTFRVTDEANVA